MNNDEASSAPSCITRLEGLRLIQTLDLPLNGDSVECCSNEEGNTVLACGMYQLRDGAESAEQQTRDGSIILYGINKSEPRLQEKFRANCAGVFDMKWSQQDSKISSKLLLAAACSDGQVSLFDSKLNAVSNLPGTDNGFCLAVDWENNSDGKLVVSCSTGEIQILDAAKEEQVLSWSSHVYPHDSSPAEIWTVAWGSNNCSNMIASGADEGCLKIWDARSEKCVLQVRRSAHDDCGVCSVQFDPNQDGCLVTGGYDGRTRLWDVRLLKSALKTSAAKLGGGVWRVRTLSNGCLLTACMRGGFRVLSSDNWATVSLYSEAEDDHWEALAYGADWLDDRLFGGCSFYDKKLRLFEAATSN